jgi:hypothetical protein
MPAEAPVTSAAEDELGRGSQFRLIVRARIWMRFAAGGQVPPFGGNSSSTLYLRRRLRVG